MEKIEAGRFLCDFLAERKMPAGRLEKLSPADWESLEERARRFKVRGLFYLKIKSRDFPSGLIPTDVRDRLREAYRHLATKNTGLFLDALKVLKSLADRQVPVMALKGLALAKNIYGDIALRPMSDVDLLVKEEDLVRAGRILQTLGYKQDFPAWESMLRVYHHLPPFTNRNGTIIELHWNIVTPESPIKVDLEGLWERSCPISIDQVAARTLSPEDMLLHLCIHACFHLQTGLDLIPFCDTAGLIKNYADKTDWKTFMERACRWGGRKCAYLMLLLVRELLGASPPDNVMSEIKPDDYQPVFFEKALEQIFNEKPSGPLIRRRVGKLSKIKKIRGIKGKASALFKEVFPSRAYLAGIYPVSVSSPKIYLCYLHRLRRLIAFTIKALLRIFRRDQSVLKEIDHEHRMSTVSDWLFS